MKINYLLWNRFENGWTKGKRGINEGICTFKNDRIWLCVEHNETYCISISPEAITLIARKRTFTCTLTSHNFMKFYSNNLINKVVNGYMNTVTGSSSMTKTKKCIGNIWRNTHFKGFDYKCTDDRIARFTKMFSYIVASKCHWSELHNRNRWTKLT